MASSVGERTNLQCFLDCITPSVETRVLQKSSFRASNALYERMELETIKYFALGELWNQYYEGSAYGVGTDVLLDDGKNIVQYYAPYLSGIQLYTKKVFDASRSSTGENSSSSSTGQSQSSKDADKDIGHLYFEFFEVCSPYGRIPLVNMIRELAQNFPGLITLKSTELTPASWLAVAWYPIYQIPAQHNVKGLSTCFLTYHAICPSYKDNIPPVFPSSSCEGASSNGDGRSETQPVYEGNINVITFPPFGLATYKLQGTLWNNPENGDQERLASLFTAADSWLKDLGVQHHDFNYFTTHPG